MTRKLIEFISGEINEYVKYMEAYIGSLSFYCIACVIRIDMENGIFPPSMDDLDDVESWLKESTDEDEDIDEQKMQCEYEENMGCFFTGEPLRTIRSLDIKDIESFGRMAEICKYLEDGFSLYNNYPDIITAKTVSYFLVYSNAAIGKIYELIGYWTAKMERPKKNPGAEAMKKRGERNRKTVKEVLDKLQIEDTSKFRHDKKLREQFFAMTKQLADCGSEDRILKIARSIVKG